MNKKTKLTNKQNEIYNESTKIIVKLNYLTDLIKKVNGSESFANAGNETQREMAKSVIYMERAELLIKFNDLYDNNSNVMDIAYSKNEHIKLYDNELVDLEEYSNFLVDYVKKLYDSNVFVDNWMKAVNEAKEVRMD